MSDWERVPGFVSAKEAHGETTVTVEPASIRDACAFARDELGFDFLADVVATDYLNWGTKGVSGYIGTAAGRDLNLPMTQGLQSLPEAKPNARRQTPGPLFSTNPTAVSRRRRIF